VIEYEGIGGTNEHTDGSLFNGSWFATGENYVITRKKRGVEALGDVLSEGLGMNYKHTISIYAMLGQDMFAMMMKSIFDQEVGEDSIEVFLLMLSHAKNNSPMREHEQNNKIKHRWLQKLLDNGVQLDHAEEAKLNKLEAAHQKYNSRMRECKRNNKIKRHWLQKLVDNGVQLDHADEAKLNKLEAARRKKNDCMGFRGL
jgi:hypothetical protein